jgi:hypothetical protein
MPVKDQELITALETVVNLLGEQNLQRQEFQFALLLEPDCDFKLLAVTIATAVRDKGRTVYSLKGDRGTDGKIVLIVKC